MTPDINYMRAAVAKMYPSAHWKRRVKRMPNGQVTAIFMREEQKKADAKAKKRKEQRDGGSDLPF